MLGPVSFVYRQTPTHGANRPNASACHSGSRGKEASGWLDHVGLQVERRFLGTLGRIRETASASNSPAFVSRRPRWCLWNSAIPIWPSNCLIWLLTATRDVFSSSDALVKLKCLLATSKTTSEFAEGNLYFNSSFKLLDASIHGFLEKW